LAGFSFARGGLPVPVGGGGRRGPAALREISALAKRCGAEVCPAALSGALAAILRAERDDVVVGLDAADDAAVIAMGGTWLEIRTVD
jgi:selenide, water dikinase